MNATLVSRWRTDQPSGYLGFGLPPWLVSHTVDWVASRILEEAPRAQAIAFRGISGALVAPIVAYKLGLNPIGVRKPNDNSHGCRAFHHVTIERTYIERYVIVDDFIESGSTVRAIAASDYTDGRELLAIFCYAKPVDWNTPIRVKDGQPLVKAYGCIPDNVHQELFGF